MALYIQALDYNQAKKIFKQKIKEDYEDEELVVTIAYPKIKHSIQITFTEGNEAYIWINESGGMRYWIRNQDTPYEARWDFIYKWAVLGCRKNWYNFGRYNAANMLHWLKK